MTLPILGYPTGSGGPEIRGFQADINIYTQSDSALEANVHTLPSNTAAYFDVRDGDVQAVNSFTRHLEPAGNFWIVPYPDYDPTSFFNTSQYLDHSDWSESGNVISIDIGTDQTFNKTGFEHQLMWWSAAAERWYFLDTTTRSDYVVRFGLPARTTLLDDITMLLFYNRSDGTTFRVGFLVTKYVSIGPD